MPLRAVVPAPEPERPSAEIEPPAPLREMPAETLLEDLEVVVVDDEMDARDLIAAVLRKCGARVRTAAAVDEAIAMVRERRPDVLLSDIGLPNEDGYALIRRLREIDPTIRSAAITAYAGADARHRALEAGFDAHLEKPVEPADLTLVVASLAGRVVVPLPERESLERNASAG